VGFEERAVRYGIRRADAKIRLVAVPAHNQRAQEVTQRTLYNLRIERALVTGVCGLLSPELQPGDAVIYDEVCMGQYDPIKADAALCEELRDLFPEAYPKARGLTVPSIVTSIEDKAEIAARYHANAVDTETFGIVAALKNAGVETAVLRFGSDAASDVLPDINAAIREDGSIDGGGMFREMLRKPIGGLRLVLGGSVAISRLARAIEKIARARR
jgi:hypothetical protein